jgi:hypothetical protein
MLNSILLAHSPGPIVDTWVVVLVGVVGLVVVGGGIALVVGVVRRGGK